MTSPFRTENGHRIHTGFLCVECVSNTHALVHGLHPVGFESCKQVFWRAMTARLHYWNVFIEYDIGVEVVVYGSHRREEAKIHTKRLVG